MMLLSILFMIFPQIFSKNKTIAIKTVKDIERTIIFNDYMQTSNTEFEEVFYFLISVKSFVNNLTLDFANVLKRSSTNI